MKPVATPSGERTEIPGEESQTLWDDSSTRASHPDLASEQGYIDLAYVNGRFQAE